MTLARTAARLAVVNALDGATAAANRVYDSQIVDFDPEVYAGDGKPAITILSDQDEGQALSDQNGGPPFRRYIEIVVEISLFQTLALEGLDPDGNPYPEGAYAIAYPDTDAKGEASLDFIEYQVIRRLSADNDPKCALFRGFVRIVKATSHRQTADETARKIASRILTLECDVTDDQLPLPNNPASGFDRLPEPLRTVAMSFAPGSEGYKICAGLAMANDPLVIPLFQGMDISADADPGVDNGGSDTVIAKTTRPV